ncbi:hypothetical protein GE21DRAFT_1223188, partial [Neurospora crassa]
ISYDECSDSVILLLPMAINSSTRRFENSIYNPLAEFDRRWVRKLFFEFVKFIPSNFE